MIAIIILNMVVIIDADIIGNEHRVGHDLIDDYGLMIGFGRVVEYSTLEVVNDGQNGEARTCSSNWNRCSFQFASGSTREF